MRVMPKMPVYPLFDENVSLKPDFPIHLISYSDPQEPISSLHSHDVLELGVCMRGSGTFIIGNSIHSYEAGDMVAIGPGVYHRAKSGIGMKDFWHFFYFRPADWQKLPGSKEFPKLIRQADDTHLYELMRTVIDEIQGRKSDCRESIAGLLQSICVRLGRLDHPGEGPAMFSPSPKMDKRIAKAIDLIQKNPCLGIPHLARQCCLSESQFRHLFKRLVGMSPKQFQTKLKIQTAMNQLKAKNTSVLDISCECGFESLSSFNRHFKRQTGLSPLQWRYTKKSGTPKPK